MKVLNLDKVILAFDDKLRKYNRGMDIDGTCSVIVGYTAEYAIYVHENLEANHVVGQAKYLEQPAREMGDQIAGVIVKALKNGASVIDALYLGGLFLQRESQLLVPVLTGNLKGSAVTEKE